MRPTRVHLAVAGLVVAAVVGSSAPAEALSTSRHADRRGPASSFYLALGDSVAFGYQSTRDPRTGPPPAAVFDHGYVDDVTRILQAGPRSTTTVNFGCPGESTMTFVHGGCPWTTHYAFSLHDNFVGNQLDAAIAFLRAHRGRVELVTLTLWGNDVIEFIDSCDDQKCIIDRAPEAIAELGRRLGVIVRALRRAAPDAEIVVTGPWNSNIDDFTSTDPMFTALGAAMHDATNRAGGRYAEMLPTFNPQGDLNTERAAICALTLLCANGDSHPSDLGYQTMAELVIAAIKHGHARHS